MGQTEPVFCTFWQAQEQWAWWGLFGVYLTRLQLLTVYVRAECMIERVGLGHGTHWSI